MKTEDWSLVVAATALFFSVALPLWFRWMDSREKISEKRSVLLQKILSVKSMNYSTRMQISFLLQRYGDRMEETQYRVLNAQLERIKSHEEQIWRLHDKCSDYKDGKTIRDLDEILKNVSVAESEAVDMADSIDKGIKSYE